MNPRLHKMLLELDSIDFTTEEYFKWSELKKTQLTSDIVRFFVPLIDRHREQVMFGMMKTIEEAINNEDYEQADILTRCLRSLEKMTL